MASMLIDVLDGSTVTGWIGTILRRIGGVALLALAVFVGLSLAGFDSGDPSLNFETGAPVSNMMGPAGAIAADLLLQTFGLASAILPLSLLFLGSRLALDRRLALPWLPVLALPLALMLVAAYLAIWPIGDRGAWVFHAGLGGVVGDFELLHLQPHMSVAAYGWGTLVGGVVATILSLGLRWRESLTTARQIGRQSARVGRQVGAAALSASSVSGRLIGDGLKRMEQMRPAGAPAFAGERSFKIDGDEESSSAFVRLARQAVDWVKSWRGDGEESLIHLDLGAADQPSRTRARRVAATAPMPVDEEAAEPAAAPRQKAPSRTQVVDASEAFELPTLDFLTAPRQSSRSTVSKAALGEVSRQLETVLDDFGVRGQIIDAKPGPVVTLFELEPAPGTRSQRVVSLADDIARSLCALSVRVATVPGRNVIGVELPNEQREIVFLRELLQSAPFTSSEARLPLALGKDISGNTIIVDLARMPHLLIAGTTGSGKSVAINAMILSLLYRLTPDQCRIIMIDPKVIELSVYEDIPHLLAPVVTEPHKAVVALKWVVRQMDERYRLMSHLGVRDIFAYNRRLEQARAKGQELTRRVRVGFEPGTGQPIMEDQPVDMNPLPLIVVIVDEVADLMLTAGKEIESAIQRLSQKARAAGIHLIVATQRPSVDVLTGVIKANLPSRISFRVSSKIDSRTILGEPGAEQLLGQGDMLYLMPGDRIMRVHGALVSDNDVERVVTHLRAQGEPDYEDSVTDEAGGELALDEPMGVEAGTTGDGLFNQAVQIVARDGKASTSYLQRKLSIGYNSAAKLIERMEAEGLITTADHVGRRQVLMGRGGVDGNESTMDEV